MWFCILVRFWVQIRKHAQMFTLTKPTIIINAPFSIHSHASSEASCQLAKHYQQCMHAKCKTAGNGNKRIFSFSFLKINHFWKYNLCRKRFLFHEFPESIFFFVCLVAWLECKLTGTAYRHGKVNSFICVLRSMKMNQQK